MKNLFSAETNLFLADLQTELLFSLINWAPLSSSFSGWLMTSPISATLLVIFGMAKRGLFKPSFGISEVPFVEPVGVVLVPARSSVEVSVVFSLVSITAAMMTAAAERMAVKNRGSLLFEEGEGGAAGAGVSGEASRLLMAEVILL